MAQKHTAAELGEMMRASADSVWTQLRKAYPMIQTQTPRIIFNKRLKTTGGRAFITETPQYIDLCNDMVWQHPENYRDVIIPHELAHCAAWVRYADSGHGNGWKLVMAYLGEEPNRCHNMVNASWNRK